MRTNIITHLIALLLPLCLSAQQTDTTKKWSLNECIENALKQNIDVRKSILTNMTNNINTNQAKKNILPTVSGSIRQNFSWQNETDASGFTGSNNSSYSVNSNILLYNGSRLNTLIKQAKIDMQKGLYDSESIKESISLSILNAYLQILYTEEQVNNAEKQIEATSEQLNLAEERYNLSIISRADLMQVKSQLASEELNLANKQSQYTIAKVTLMQLMELPVDNNFDIVHPEFGESLNSNLAPDANNIFAIALGIKPQVKSAEYQKQSAALNEKIAKAGFLPTISADAGIGTGYSSSTDQDYFRQLNDQISPSAGLTVSIPIFQKNQIKTNVSLAKINLQNAELSQTNTLNQLRKEIEQACVDVVSAQVEYEASKKQIEATKESYLLAEEKYKNGLLNAVDYLFEKTNMIVAESNYLQSKYNLIFSYKILNFYTGTPINL